MPIPIIVGDEPEFPPLPPCTARPSTSESAGAVARSRAAAAAAADEEAAAQNTVVQTPAPTTQQTDFAQARPETLSVEARLAFARTTPIPPRTPAPAASTTVPPPRPAMPPQHAAGTAAARIAAQRAGGGSAQTPRSPRQAAQTRRLHRSRRAHRLRRSLRRVPISPQRRRSRFRAHRGCVRRR